MASVTDPTKKFDAFVEEHEALERSLHELRELIQQQQDGGATIYACRVLGEHVHAHFRHEVQEDGFFANLIEQAPRFEDRARELIGQHAQLNRALTDLQEFAVGDQPSPLWWKGLGYRLDAFWHLFCQHEHEEIRLVQEAFGCALVERE